MGRRAERLEDKCYVDLIEWYLHILIALSLSQQLNLRELFKRTYKLMF